MQIISSTPQDRTIITGRLLVGSDRQVQHIAEYQVIIEDGGNRYEGTLPEGDEQAIVDAYAGGQFTQIRKSPVQERIERLETQNLTLMIALAELAEAKEADKLTVQLALAELAEIITGGE